MGLVWKDEVSCEHDFKVGWCIYRLATTVCQICALCGKVELLDEDKGNERLITKVMVSSGSGG